jgi:hypothetical protein
MMTTKAEMNETKAANEQAGGDMREHAKELETGKTKISSFEAWRDGLRAIREANEQLTAALDAEADTDDAVSKLADAIFDAEDALHADPLVNAILEAKAVFRDSVWFETRDHTFNRNGDWRVDECLLEELAEWISGVVEDLPKP